jgi:hypothetical protein
MKILAQCFLFFLLLPSSILPSTAAPSTPLTLDFSARTAPALEVYQANAKDFAVTLKNSGAAFDLTGYTPAFYWAPSNTSPVIVTAACTVVSATGGTFTASLSASDLNSTGNKLYGVGVVSNSATIARQGTLTILPDPFAAGAAPVTWTTNINAALINWLNPPWTNTTDAIARANIVALSNSITAGTITVNGVPLAQIGLSTNTVQSWIAATNAVQQSWTLGQIALTNAATLLTVDGWLSATSAANNAYARGLTNALGSAAWLGSNVLAYVASAQQPYYFYDALTVTDAGEADANQTYYWSPETQWPESGYVGAYTNEVAPGYMIFRHTTLAGRWMLGLDAGGGNLYEKYDGPLDYSQTGLWFAVQGAVPPPTVTGIGDATNFFERTFYRITTAEGVGVFNPAHMETISNTAVMAVTGARLDATNDALQGWTRNEIGISNAVFGTAAYSNSSAFLLSGQGVVVSITNAHALWDSQLCVQPVVAGLGANLVLAGTSASAANWLAWYGGASSDKFWGGLKLGTNLFAVAIGGMNNTQLWATVDGVNMTTASVQALTIGGSTYTNLSSGGGITNGQSGVTLDTFTSTGAFVSTNANDRYLWNFYPANSKAGGTATVGANNWLYGWNFSTNSGVTVNLDAVPPGNNTNILMRGLCEFKTTDITNAVAPFRIQIFSTLTNGTAISQTVQQFNVTNTGPGTVIVPFYWNATITTQGVAGLTVQIQSFSTGQTRTNNVWLGSFEMRIAP